MPLDNVFSHGKISYGTMFVNPKTSSLYVGARGHLFRLWLYNINDTSTSLVLLSNLEYSINYILIYFQFVNRVFHLRAEELEECHRMGNSKMECDVWVREIFSKGDGQQQLVLCSSQSMKPTIGTIDSQKLNDIDEFRTMIGICSQQENLNTTAVFVGKQFYYLYIC
jgi:hypothetical protein